MRAPPQLLQNRFFRVKKKVAHLNVQPFFVLLQLPYLPEQPGKVKLAPELPVKPKVVDAPLARLPL